MIPSLQRHGARFSQRNTFVYAVLGVVAVVDEIDRALHDPEPGEPLHDAAHAEGIYFLLGLASVGRTVRGVVQRLVHDGGEVPSEPARPMAALRGLLR